VLFLYRSLKKETKVNPLELSKAVGAVTDEDLRRAAAASQAAHRHTVLVRELAAHHRSRLLKHFLALGEEDRLLRFGQSVGDHVVEAYVDSIDFDHDSVFGVYDENLELIGVGHFANLRDNAQGRVAEFGVSVSKSARGRGIGSALFERAAIHGRNTSVRTLYMHCLSRNAAMMHIAKKAGMKVQYAYGEADAYLELTPADTVSRLTEALDEQVADLDYMMRRNLRDARRFGLRFWRSLVPQKHTV
jgi:RimJ/RimL family protein N-acetyltransferase